MVKPFKVVLPFLAVVLFAVNVSAATFNFTVSGTTNGTSDTKNVYFNYTRGLSGIEEDSSGYTRYIYDIPITSYFGTSAEKYTSGYFKLNIDIDLQASDLVIAYADSFECEVPFTVDQSNIASGIFSVNFSVYYNDFQHDSTNVPLPSFTLHCVTSSSSIPAINSISARSGCRYVITNSTSAVGLENALANAINNSADVNEMIDILTDISSNTELLNSVINKLSDLDTKLSLIITALNTNNSQNEASILLLQKLLKGLTGEDASTSITAISGKTRLYWIGIIQQALQIDDEKAEEVSSQVENVGDQISNQHSQEQVAFDDFDSAYENVSGHFNAIPPEQITAPVSVVVGWLQTLYTKLGIFQYVIIITLTVGIVLVVLGRFRLR